MKNTLLPLEVVGQLVVPDGVMGHRFACEALGCAMVFQQLALESCNPYGQTVVGTANTGDVELYGWAPNVDNHVDKTGLIYFAAINDGRTMVEVLDGEQPYSVKLEKGAVVRLNDFCEHWTIDTGPRVCVFVGSFPVPHDEWAVKALQAGVDALARGDYYGAPRVRDGFRAYLSDECLVPNDGFSDCAPMLLSDAKAQDKYYELCQECNKPAVKLAPHWPYTMGGWCSEHL